MAVVCVAQYCNVQLLMMMRYGVLDARKELHTGHIFLEVIYFIKGSQGRGSDYRNRGRGVQTFPFPIATENLHSTPENVSIQSL